MSDIETAREFCDRVPRELGLVDFNSFEARRLLEKRLSERDEARDAAIRLAAKLEGKREALGDISLALLSDRNTSHQRDDWAPVLRRIQDKYSPTSKEASGEKDAC